MGCLFKEGKMINKLKDWRLLLLISAVLCYGLILLTMMNDFYELPNEAFSKEVYLRDYQKLDTYEAYDDKSFASGPLEDGFYLLVNDGDQLIYETYSLLGELKTSDIIKDDQETIIDMSGIIEGSTLTYVLVTETTISRVTIEIDDKQLKNETRLSNGYEMAVLKDDKVIFSENNVFYYHNGNKIEVFEDSSIKKLDFVIANEMVYVSTIARNAGSFYTDFYSINVKEDTVNKTFVRNYITSNSTRDADHKVILEGSQLRAMSVFRDNRSSNTFYKESLININDPSDFSFYKFEMTDFPNFTYLESSDKQVTMMLEKFTFVGKDELASANSTFRNLVLMTRDGDTIESRRMTKMKKAHPIYHYFAVQDYDYLVFNTVDYSEGKIYYASNQSEVIENSNSIDGDSLKSLMLGALTVIPAALAVGFIPSMGYVFPVILIIMPISMIKVTWTERYPEKMFLIALGVYFISLFGGFYENATMILNTLQDMSGALPWHLHSVINMYSMLAFTFGLSYLSYMLFKFKHPRSSFMIQFGVLFMTQSVLYILLFNAYPLLAN